MFDQEAEQRANADGNTNTTHTVELPDFLSDEKLPDSWPDEFPGITKFGPSEPATSLQFDSGDINLVNNLGNLAPGALVDEIKAISVIACRLATEEEHERTRAPANFEQKFHVQQAKLGDSVRLECQASGDQPIQIDWLHEGNQTVLERNGNDFYEIHETPTDSGLLSYMQLRSLGMHDSQLYKCLARNEFGSSERIIKLIVSNVPDRPEKLRVRDVWSRSALVSWAVASSSETTNGPPSLQHLHQHQQYSAHPSVRVTNFTVQYWRKSGSAPAGQVQSQQQNHRRESLVVDGLQTSALLPNLQPALSYEVSVIAQNQVGQSEPSETIQVTTSEEEPSAPPTDVQVETHGGSTIRVMWKVPPGDSLNGKLLGFYIGYRPRTSLQSSGSNGGAGLMPLNNNVIVHQQQQQLQSAQMPIYSFKTADAIEGLAYYETFLSNLKHLSEYEVTVRAFNKAGSGPDCHVLIARTGSPRLPGPPTLQVQRVTSSAVSLRWTAPVMAQQRVNAGHQYQHQQLLINPIAQQSAPLVQLSGQQQQQQQQQLANGAQLHYELFYQVQGERDWYQLSVTQAPTSLFSTGNSLPFQLENELPLQVQQLGPGLPMRLSQSTSGPGNELTGGEQTFMVPPANIHTLSNLQPGLSYKIYVAASNELGLGDPSNVVTVRTSDLTAPANSMTSAGAQSNSVAAFLGQTTGQADSRGGGGGATGQHELALDSQFASLGGASGSGGANGLLAALTQPQHGLFYTMVSSATLVAMLISLIGYLIWQRRLKCKYNSSSASSYPSSWTPAASDTIQSEYSIKRLPGSLPQPQDQELYDEVECVVAQHQQRSTRSTTTTSIGANKVQQLHFSSARLGSAKQQQKQQQQQLRNSATIGRPVLSSHYHQPNSLIASSGSSATLQFAAAHQRHHQAGGLQLLTSGTNQQHQLGPSTSNTLRVQHHQQQHFKTSATLNRHQNRQLPPVPYSTMKEQQQQQQQGRVSASINAANVSSQQQQAAAGGGNSRQQAAANYGHATSFSGQCGGGSQTPLIYGVIE